MNLYTIVISYSGSLDNELDSQYWDKARAFKEARAILLNDEVDTLPSEYEIECVYVHTNIPDDNGSFRTIKTDTFRH